MKDIRQESGRLSFIRNGGVGYVWQSGMNSWISGSLSMFK